MTEFHAYIDEAGDEGFGKLRQPGKGGQSRWFAIGGIVVSDANDRFIPSWRNEVMRLFPSKNQRDLHFRYLNHSQRVAACRLLAEKPLGVCVVASNKETILRASELAVYKNKQHLYNYLVRFVMERLTTSCMKKAESIGAKSARLHVTFSRRAGTDYNVMKEYFEFMRGGNEKLKPKRSINWDVFDPKDIRVENHSVRAGLQLADVVTSASFSALEPNEFGDVEPRYAESLMPRFIRQNRSILDCGLTIVPQLHNNPLNPQQLSFIQSLKL